MGEPPPPPPRDPGGAGGTHPDRRHRRAVLMAAEPLRERAGPVRGCSSTPTSWCAAVASGRRKGQRCRTCRAARSPRRAPLRRPQGRTPPAGDVVRRHAGAHRQPPVGDEAEAAVDALLAEPFGNWHVDTTDPDPPAAGDQEGRGAGAHPAAPSAVAADARPRPRQGPAAAPRTTRCWSRSGISDAQGRIKPSRQAKYRQVEEFLRLLDASITDALAKGTCASRPPTTRCASSTSAAATPTSPSPRSASSPTCAACRSG